MLFMLDLTHTTPIYSYPLPTSGPYPPPPKGSLNLTQILTFYYLKKNNIKKGKFGVYYPDVTS